MKKIAIITGILTGLVVFNSCSTMNQKVVLAPIDTEFPVSASQSLLVNNTVIDKSKFKNEETFSFEKKFTVPVTETDAVFDVSSDLSKQLQNTDYNGITQLQFNIMNIDSSATKNIASERGVGVFVALLGGLYWYLVPENNNSIPFIMIGSGAGLYGASYLHQKFGKVEYDIKMEGVKVSF